jgi:HlyD family secretion protein
MPQLETELHRLRIDRSEVDTRPSGSSPKARIVWISVSIASALILIAILGREVARRPMEVAVQEVHLPSRNGTLAGSAQLNATGYIVAAHSIELASKVVGRVAWIGVDKGDKVRKGQELVRLENQEYLAQALQAKGQLENLKAHLAELEHGSRPQEIQRAGADLDAAHATTVNARLTLDRTKQLAHEGVVSRQALDDAEAKYESASNNEASLQRTYDLAKVGPRQEEIDAARAQVVQAQGSFDYAQEELQNTIIRAPVAGTILDRNVETGEFVTNGFVGDKGAKGYVVSLADLDDLEVELDINQSDFGKIQSTDTAWAVTDAYPDRKYEAKIVEISPEANRQKGTVQVKVRILHPDSYLRPEMNASVAFVTAKNSQITYLPAPATPFSVALAAVRQGTVFVVVNGSAEQRSVTVGRTEGDKVEIRRGLQDGDLLIVNPPSNLRSGDKVRIRKD